jgi:hypothetical protein
MTPPAIVNFGLKDPSLAPKHDYDPDTHKEVWKAQDPLHRQIEPNLAEYLHAHVRDNMPTTTHPECPQAIRNS